MKFIHSITILCVLVFTLFICGCTTPSSPERLPTPSPQVTPSPVLTAVPYPNAFSLNQPVTFGSAERTGQITVYRYDVRRNYNWTSPSWRSPREQAAYAPAMEIQRSYNTEKPPEGKVFLFIFIRIINTGTKSVYTPSPSLFLVNSDGKMYNYSSLKGPDVTLSDVSGKQYDYLFGTGGSGGYVQPGLSNKAEGFLIYIVPADFSAEKTYLVSNIEGGIWKLG